MEATTSLQGLQMTLLPWGNAFTTLRVSNVPHKLLLFETDSTKVCRQLQLPGGGNHSPDGVTIASPYADDIYYFRLSWVPTIHDIPRWSVARP